MNSEDERRLKGNWSLLVQDLRPEEFLDRFVEMGLLTAPQGSAILGDSPDGRGDRFLQAVIKGGNRTYQNMCNILLEMDNPKYQKVLTALDIVKPSPGNRDGLEQRSSTLTSVCSLDSGRGESVCEVEPRSRLESARQPWRTEPLHTLKTDLEPEPEKAEAEAEAKKESGGAQPQEHPPEAERQQTADELVKTAVAKVSMAVGGSGSEGGKPLAVDMETLEKELMSIAPTIADLFTKISKQTKQITATSDDELERIKEDNERLRKTNKNLIEKLNTFQSKIIQLQLENKKLKDVSDSEKHEQQELIKKSSELDSLKDKLVEQKQALEEKERELDQQIQKINGIVKENEEQRKMIMRLEELHEEGIYDFEMQQDQLVDLIEEKERQKEQIEQLEENQKMSEMIFQKMEERLAMLERGDGGARRNRQRNQFGITRRTPWTGAGTTYDKSHHANVKFPNDALTKGKFPNDALAKGKFPNDALAKGKFPNDALTKGKFLNDAFTKGKFPNDALTKGKGWNV